MDTLPSSVSSLKVPLVHRKSTEFSRFKPLQTASSQSLPSSSINSISTNIKQLATKNTSIPFTTASSSFHLSPRQLPSSSSLKQSALLHRNAATGYAAALIDVAQTNKQLNSVEKDVRRLWKLLLGGGNHQLRSFLKDPEVNESEKGEVVKEIAEKGKFHKHLVVLVKMLVEKRKLGMVSQVLMEFQRIFHQLTITGHPTAMPY